MRFMGKYLGARQTVRIVVTGLLIWIYTGTADAHRVIVFAWVEGDTVHVEGKFPGGKKVRQGRVLVYDPGGSLLLEGETDEKGTFDFQIPKQSSLQIVLEAGMGHRAEWTIPEEEVTGTVPQKGDPAVPQVGEGKKITATPEPGNRVSTQEIQSAVEKALDKKLQPIVRMLAESRQSGPSLLEVLGGIGYIAGLVGVAAYFHSRRRTRESGADMGRQEMK